ncbi:MAG: DoxX family membrane protein [Chitinophagaceae bacterium]|nr:DoxX family membrane protein [Chitinophagaceae bacterium]
MNQHIIARAAIYLLSVIMIIFGVYHLQNPRNMVAFVPANLPGGINWVYFVGVVLILAAVAFILNKFVKVTAYLLALLLIVFVIVIHWPAYHDAGDVDIRRTAFIDILQNLAMAAFALHIAGSADSHGMKY